MKRVTFIALSALSLSCSDGVKKSGNGQATTPDETAAICERKIAEPTPSPTSGVLNFSLPISIDPCSVSGYAVGYPDQLEVQATTDGNYIVNNAPPGTLQIIVNGLTVGTALTGEKVGIRTEPRMILTGVKTPLGELSLQKLGSLSGILKAEGQTNNAGIDVYIPGTRFIAKTDDSGAFSFADVPPGKHNLYVDKDGFRRGRFESVVVGPAVNTDVGSITLAPSTGAEGFVLIEGSPAAVNTRTVKVIIGASENANLMKVAEEPSFTNKSWEPLKTTTSFTFSNDGPKSLYVMFADANGLSSSPFKVDVIVDTEAPTISDLTYLHTMFYSGIAVPRNKESGKIGVISTDQQGTGVMKVALYQQEGEELVWNDIGDYGEALLPDLTPGSKITQLCAKVKDAFNQVSIARCENFDIRYPKFSPPFLQTEGWVQASSRPAAFKMAQKVLLASGMTISGMALSICVDIECQAELRDDAGGVPGSIINSFIDNIGPVRPTHSSTAFPERFTHYNFSTPVVLSANTPYWITVDYSSVPTIVWNQNPNVSYEGGAPLMSTDGNTWVPYAGELGGDFKVLPFMFF